MRGPARLGLRQRLMPARIRCHHASHRDWVREHQGNQPSGRRDNDCSCPRLRLSVSLFLICSWVWTIREDEMWELCAGTGVLIRCDVVLQGIFCVGDRLFRRRGKGGGGGGGGRREGEWGGWRWWRGGPLNLSSRTCRGTCLAKNLIKKNIFTYGSGSFRTEA